MPKSDNILTDKFLSKYQGKQPNWGFNGLGYIVFRRTYSRVKPDGKSEEWWETVARCVEGAQKIGAQYTPEEAERLYDHVFHLRCNFAGRMLWQLGTSTVERFHGNSLLNCWFRTMNEPKAFLFVFENLMLGGGLGFSVRREDVHELPRVKPGVTVTNINTKDADFIVPDSREGWIKLLEHVLNAYYVTGKSFTYSTILVRTAGEKIAGFGGTASGPKILVDGMEKISKVFRDREGKKLRSIDVLDICNIIGSIVVSGNVRRSAQVALGDPDDYYFLRAKNWSLGDVPNWRAMSNNTIYADSFDHISEQIWDNGYEINADTGRAKGEPYGFFNLPLSQKYGRIKDGPMKDSRLYPVERDNCSGGNPCQPAWAPILTKEGLRQMKDIEEGTEIWSETGWTTVAKKWSTGVKKVFRYQTTGGVFFGTENHRVVCNHDKIEAAVAEGIDQLVGPYSSDLVLDTQDIMDGIVFGDGTVHEASNDLVCLCVGKDDKDYLTSEVSEWIGDHRPGISPYIWEISTQIKASELPLTYVRSIPERYLYGTRNKAAAFLRGLYTANGSIVADRVTLKASSFKVIQQVQMILSSLGIRSYYTTNRPTTVTFSNGDYLCRESYDLNITKDRAKFAAIIGFIQQYKTEKLDALLETVKPSSRAPKLTYDIISRDFVSEEEVFDITVDNEPHTYWTGGVNVSNCMEVTLSSSECCNLAELYLNNIETKDQLIDCAKLLYKTQKAISAMPFLHEETNEIVHKNMRLGLGVTGICQSLSKLEWLDECYVELRRFDKEWSKQRGWPRSIKLTVVKPSGTLSLLAGATPGVHPAYSAFYIRRVRMSSEDKLVRACRDAGYHTEYARNFDDSEDRATMIVSFPCKTPEGAILAKDMDIIKQLDMVVKLQSIWADNAVSVTAYYEPSELKVLKGWLKENYDKSIKSVSFLLRSLHGFKQAPYEEITEEQYVKLAAMVKPIRIEDGDSGLDISECASGACPIK